MNTILKFALKFLSYDALVETIAKSLAYILEYARAKASEDAWEKAKSAVKQINNWTTLLNEVYEDDTLTPDEEKKIADAIANMTATETIYGIVTGKKKPTKKSAKKPAKKSARKTTRKA